MTFKKDRRIPTVAIVGRANVGKSTLWNRLTETREAIVSPEAHTTRDRHYGISVWRGLGISVVDTGGLDSEQGSDIGRGILAQAEKAVKDADIVLFLVDVKTGVVPEDIDFLRRIRKINSHILLVANKVDTAKRLPDAATKAMFSFGCGQPIPVSASTSLGIGDLLDQVYEDLVLRGKHPVPLEEDDKGLKLVLMGKPNVGKSSLMNAILGEERAIVSATPHTTREPQDTTFEWREKKITLIDTAGMRKRSRIEKGIETASIERNKAALLRADIALLILDATERPSTQDRHLAGLLEDAGRGLIIVANKWDLVEEKKTQTADEYEFELRRAFPFLSWAPIIFVSAKERQRTGKILDLAEKIEQERARQLTYNALQKFLKTAIAKQPPQQAMGPKQPFVYDIAEIGIRPPTFLIRLGGQKIGIHENWLRYIENRLREKFGFEGTPIRIRTRHLPVSMGKKKEDKAQKKHPWARTRRPVGRRSGRY